LVHVNDIADGTLHTRASPAAAQGRRRWRRRCRPADCVTPSKKPPAQARSPPTDRVRAGVSKVHTPNELVHGRR
jgi:hypothetical protein